MTAWELGMLAAKGRLSFPMPIRAWLDQVVTTGQLRWAELSVDVLLAATYEFAMATSIGIDCRTLDLLKVAGLLKGLELI